MKPSNRSTKRGDDSNRGLPAFKPRTKVRTPLREALYAVRDEVEEAMRKLGIDPRRNKDSRTMAEDESRQYPFTAEEPRWAALLQRPVYARLRALELIGALGDYPVHLDEWLSDHEDDLIELRKVLAQGPAELPLPVYLKQLLRDEEAA
jgi:hypothetical protein